VGLLGVFVTAALLNPYHPDGSPRTSETHLQLGLKPCSFKVMTNGLPCPSCGFTTSFTHLTHGVLNLSRGIGLLFTGDWAGSWDRVSQSGSDLWNSLRANAVGTLLALVCLLFIPWALLSAARSRPMFVLTVERPLIFTVVVLVILMMVRWVIVVLLHWWST
jgi:hypothetical protein